MLLQPVEGHGLPLQPNGVAMQKEPLSPGNLTTKIPEYIRDIRRIEGPFSGRRLEVMVMELHLLGLSLRVVDLGMSQGQISQELHVL